LFRLRELFSFGEGSVDECLVFRDVVGRRVHITRGDFKKYGKDHVLSRRPTELSRSTPISAEHGHPSGTMAIPIG
jgi:hypothetical protein